MTTEEAIKILEESQRQNEIMRDSPAVFFKSTEMADSIKNAERRIEALGLAIAALRAQQTSLDRSRREGCQYCRGDHEGYSTCFRDVSGRSRNLFIPEGSNEIVTTGKQGQKYRIKISYCPFCGRPLTEDAWAELERRMNGEKTDN